MSINKKNIDILWCDIDGCNEKWVGWPGDKLEDTVFAATCKGWIVVMPGHRCPKHRDIS